MSFLENAQALEAYPDLSAALGYDTVVTYVDLARCLKPIIALQQPSFNLEPPESLTASVHEFIRSSLGLSDDSAKLAWIALRSLAWRSDVSSAEVNALQQKHIRLFLEHGLSREISPFNILPPTRVCLDPQCRQHLLANEDVHRDRELVEARRHPVTVFTRALGAIPGFSTSLYCRNCHTRYHTNYYVHNHATLRTYYSGPFDYLQTSKHIFVSTEICELFANMMVSSWTSATNCARIYNTSMSNDLVHASLPAAFPTRLEIDTKDVWNAFFLHSLLLDHDEQRTTMVIEHNASSQADRLKPQLQSRNARMSGPGQEQWNHACDMCCWVYEEDGKHYQIRSTVTDGITIGRPCCTVHDCTRPLPHVNKLFCSEHSHLAAECVVTTCKDPAEPEHRTCTNPNHRKLEEFHNLQNKAMFQLKHRLERVKISQTHDSLPPAISNDDDLPELIAPDDDDDEHDWEELGEGSGIYGEEMDTLIDEHGLCDGKPESGNKSVRARFGRRRTHNEELCVGSCGVILGRATFFGSEAPNGVRTFWMRLFPTRQSLPAVMWHDNNCRIRPMLNNDNDEVLRTYFDNCALPVDVFHFKCKHKESDEDCGRHCNPMLWPELRTEDGKWRFNSSAAEQTNAWFGGYQAIVREMRAERYDFFLDEMIKRRNRLIVQDLRARKKQPYLIPRESLLGDNTDF